MVKDLVDEYDYRLYHAICEEEDNNKVVRIWNEIKENKEVLASAIEVKKNKWGIDTVTSDMICSQILISKDVDEDIYQKLIDLICSNKEIAKLHLYNRMFLNGSDTYLSTVMTDDDLELTEKQKRFTEEEAKDKNNFYNSDLKRNILMNPNWKIEEKANLIYEFYTDEEWDEELETMEWDIVNDHDNYKGDAFSFMDKVELYDYRYEELYEFYQNKETTDRIWENISLCKLFHQIRPQQWEIENKTSIHQLDATNKCFIKKGLV